MANSTGVHGAASLVIKRTVVWAVPVAVALLWLVCCLLWLRQVEKGPFRILSRFYGLPASRGSANLTVATESVPWARMVALAANYGPSVHVAAFGMRFRLPPASNSSETLQIGWPVGVKFPQYPGAIKVKWSGTASSWPLHQISPLSWDRAGGNLASSPAMPRPKRRHWLSVNHLLYVAVPMSPGQLTISGTGDPVPPRFYAVAERDPHGNAVVVGAWPAVSPPWVAVDLPDALARRRRVIDILERTGSTPWSAASLSAAAFSALKRMDAEDVFQTAAGILPRRGHKSPALRIACILTAFPKGGSYISRIIRCTCPEGNLYICRATGIHASQIGLASGYNDWRWLFFGPNGKCLSFGDVGCRKGSAESRVVAKTAALAGFTHGVPRPLPSPWGASVPRDFRPLFLF